MIGERGRALLENANPCRCCGKPLVHPLEVSDGYPIHTRCIPKHWGKHSKGKNAARCKEFGKRKG